MNSTVKTVLIVGGVAVGAFLLFRFMSPAATAQRRAQQTGGSYVNMVSTLIPALVTAFGSSSSSSGTYNVYPAAGGEQYIVPTGAKAFGDATGTGGFGVAGLDYPI